GRRTEQRRRPADTSLVDEHEIPRPARSLQGLYGERRIATRRRTARPAGEVEDRRTVWLRPPGTDDGDEELDLSPLRQPAVLTHRKPAASGHDGAGQRARLERQRGRAGADGSSHRCNGCDRAEASSTLIPTNVASPAGANIGRDSDPHPQKPAGPCAVF